MTSEMSTPADPLLEQLVGLGFQVITQGDDEGRPHLLQFIRTWDDGHADAISIHDETNAQALRCNPRGDVVWKVTDTAFSVLQAVVELPSPFNPLAPKLALPGALPDWLRN